MALSHNFRTLKNISLQKTKCQTLFSRKKNMKSKFKLSILTKAVRADNKSIMFFFLIFALLFHLIHLERKIISCFFFYFATKIQSNFNGWNIFRTIENCSRHEWFEPLRVNHGARSGSR